MWTCKKAIFVDVDYGEFIAYPKIKNYLFYRPVDGIEKVNCEDIQIVFQESDQWLRNEYRAKCPGMRTDKYSFDKNKYVFFVMHGGDNMSKY